MATTPRSRWAKVREHLRWRGPLIFALFLLRQLMRPIVYWDVWHIFETDVSTQVPEPYAKEKLTTRICGIEGDPDLLVTMITSMGELEPGEVVTRLSEGHLAAVAFSGERPVGYMWLAFSCKPERRFDIAWIVRPGEALRYNSFVIPSFRGRGAHGVLNQAANCYARAQGVTRTLGSVSVMNPQSMSLPKHYRRTVKMTLFLAKIRGLNWTIRKSWGAPLESRFRWPGHLPH